MEIPHFVLLVISEGCEDIETVAQIDILNRGGCHLTIATLNSEEEGLLTKCANGTRIEADVYLKNVLSNKYECITLPGGLKNAQNLASCSELIEMLRKQKESGKLFGAICASPALVFEPNGLLEGCSGTAYPGLSDKLKDQSRVNERVVVSGNCVTSRGPGTTCEYSLELVRILIGEDIAADLKKKMLIIA